MTSAVLRDDTGHELRRGDTPLLRGVRFPVSARAGADVNSRIRAVLPLYRGSLERVWSERTAHPAYRDECAANAPSGQCGVTSAWLVHQLRADHGLVGTYCYGALAIGGSVDVTIARHCWVELQLAATTYVLDLTADQAPGFNQQIVFDAKERLLADHQMRYEARIHKSQQELTLDDVWPRLVALDGALAAAQGGPARA